MSGVGAGALRAAMHCLALDALAARTLQLLASAGIPAVLIKGPATAALLYPAEPERRTYTDVDILVPVDRFLDAESTLRSNGYESMLAGLRDGEFPWHETAWRPVGSTELVIDLHRGLAGLADPVAFFAAVWATREVLSVGGTDVFVPDAAGTAVIVMLHAANPGRNRKPLTDIRRAQELLGSQVWVAAADLARLSGAVDSCRAGLGLLPNGLAMADRLGITGTVGADKWLAGRQRDRISVNLAMALDESGFRAVVSHVVRRMVPSPAFVRLFDARARSGPLGLALAYCRRFGRAFLAAPRAVLDVAAARLAVRAGGSPRPHLRIQGRASVRNKLSAGATKSSALHVPALQLVRRGRSLGRLLLASDVGAVGCAVWTVRVRLVVARQLQRGGLNAIDIPAPSSMRPKDRAAVRAVLRGSRATCLQQAVVLQRFDAATGRPRDIVIGVTAPGAGFRAHAWLAGDPQPDGELREIHRHPVPLAWTTG